MKTCHVCLTECPDNAELCPLCGADLTVLVEQENNETGMSNPVFLTKFEDPINAEIFEDILSNNNINYFSAENEEGGMKVLFGGSFFAKEIFVDESQFETASGLLAQFLENENLFDDEFSMDFEENE